MALFRRTMQKHKLLFRSTGCGVRTFSSDSKEVVYVNPSTAQDGYDLVNAKTKPTMPALGFGTWGCDAFSSEKLAESVDTALKIGYRHLDCARVYGNEKEIGAVIQDHINNGNVKREELFITSKLYNNEHAPPDGAPVRALESSLKDFGLDYLDSFLVHWPFRNSVHHPPLPFNMEQWFFTYKLIHECSLQGLTKSVGICNATIHKMKGLNDLCAKNKIAKPAINQIELHPYLQQDNVLQFCEDNDIIVTAAMPLGSPERPARFKRDDDPVPLEDEKIAEIAKECGKSVAQVIIRWHLQRGVVCIPKGTEEWMIRQNFETLQFQLNTDQMQRMDALDKHFRFMKGEVFRWKEDQKWEEMFDYE